jgi:hypothetical protein
MKNYLKIKFLVLFTSLVIMYVMNSTITADAAISAYEEMPINYTSSVDNLQYPATNQFTVLTGISGVGKVVISKPTIIKAYMNWDSSEISETVIWFSQDIRGIDIIGTQVKLTHEKNYQLILLDKGTYYFNYSLKANSSYINHNYYFTTVGVCLVGQGANSTERRYVSSKDYPNYIEFDKVETGFLSITAPIDYYKFTLTEQSIIDINFNFHDLKDINLYGSTCTLKNSMDANIVEKTYSSQGAEYNTITKILEPGSYYITMKGSTTITSLEVKKTSYVINSANSDYAYTNENVKITLKIPFEYKEILVTKGNIPKSKITDYYTWSTYQSDTTKSLSSRTYSVTENGTYTFRIQDYLGNYILHTVKIYNIDKTAPTIKGVADGKTYKTSKTIEFSDKLAGIKSAILNKKAIKSGAKVTEKGSYTLVVTDKVGNSKTIKFKIQ